MDELSMLTNVLISDKQHCVFKWNSWIFDPDDGSAKSFEDFAQNLDCKSGSMVVVRAILFDTKAAGQSKPIAGIPTTAARKWVSQRK